MRIISRRKIVLGALIVAVGGGAIWALDAYSVFGPSYVRRPVLAATQPLKPNTRTSTITVPIAVALTAVHAALDATTPRNFTGKRANPISGLFANTDIGWTIGRGAISLQGRQEELALSVALSGSLRITEQKSAVSRSDPTSEFERGVQEILTGGIDQRGEVRGSAALTARPTVLPNWRVDPKLTGHVTIANGGLSIGGMKIDVSDEVKSAIDRTVSDQISKMQTSLRDDAMIEKIARREWAKACRSISLASVVEGVPDLWLELRPTRAFVSQPLIDPNAVTLTVGAEATTRIVSAETKPDCPFPAQLEIVPPVEQGRFAVAVPIELSFAEFNRILDAQLSGRKIPEKADSASQITVLRAHVAASGERLQFSFLVEARERTSWFGLGARATVFISARPVLDGEQQKIRLTDMLLDIQSNAAWGLLGAAARTAIPYFQETLEQYAVIDLASYAASARASIENVISDYDKQEDGLSTDADVTKVRLAGIEFDSQTLRVIAEIEGAGKVAVTKLPQQ